MFSDGNGVVFFTKESAWDEECGGDSIPPVSRWHATEACPLAALLWWWPFYEQETKKAALGHVERSFTECKRHWVDPRVRASWR